MIILFHVEQLHCFIIKQGYLILDLSNILFAYLKQVLFHVEQLHCFIIKQGYLILDLSNIPSHIICYVITLPL